MVYKINRYNSSFKYFNILIFYKILAEEPGVAMWKFFLFFKFERSIFLAYNTQQISAKSFQPFSRLEGTCILYMNVLFYYKDVLILPLALLHAPHPWKYPQNSLLPKYYSVQTSSLSIEKIKVFDRKTNTNTFFNLIKF